MKTLQYLPTENYNVKNNLSSLIINESLIFEKTRPMHKVYIQFRTQVMKTSQTKPSKTKNASTISAFKPKIKSCLDHEQLPLFIYLIYFLNILRWMPPDFLPEFFRLNLQSTQKTIQLQITKRKCLLSACASYSYYNNYLFVF